MKPRVPWSVKGVNPEARAIAKASAHEAGVTLGQWLNTIITEAGDPNGVADSPDRTGVHRNPEAPWQSSPDKPEDTAPPYEPPSSPGVKKLASLQDALGTIAQKLERSEERSTLVLNDLDQAITGVAERLHAVEEGRSLQSELPSGEAILDEASRRELNERIALLEEQSHSATSARDSKQIEQVLTKIVSQVEASEKRAVGGMKTIEQAIAHIVVRLDNAENHKKQAEKNAERVPGSTIDPYAGAEKLVGDLRTQLSRTEKEIEHKIDDIRERLFDLSRSKSPPPNRVEDDRDATATLSDRLDDIDNRLYRLIGQVDDTARTQKATLNQFNDRITELHQRVDRLGQSDGIDQQETDRAPKESVSDATPVDDGHEAPSPRVEPVPVPEISAGRREPEIDRARQRLETVLRGKSAPSTHKNVSAQKRDIGSDDTEQQRGLFYRPARTLLWTIIGVAFLIMTAAAGLVVFEETAERAGLSRPKTITPLIEMIEAGRDRLDVLMSRVLPDAQDDPAGDAESTIGTPDPVRSGSSSNASDLTDHVAADDTATARITLLDEQLIWTATELNLDPEAGAASTGQDIAQLETAAANGDARAQYILGGRYFLGEGNVPDYARAEALIRRAAEQGFAPSQYRLGTMLEGGLGLPQDYVEAGEWYEEAARAGEVRAMHNLGVFYSRGSGVDRDMGKAAEWFKKAAESDLIDSQFNFAILLKDGVGVAPDPIEAYKWFAIAARKGDKEAEIQLGKIATQLSVNELATALERVREWTPQVPNITP